MDRIQPRLKLLLLSKGVMAVGSWVFTWLILQVCAVISTTSVALLLLTKMDLTVARVFEPDLLLWLPNKHISLQIGIFAVLRVLAVRIPPHVVFVSELGRLLGLVCALILISRVVKNITLIGTAFWTVTQLLLLLMLLLLVLLITTALQHVV